MKYVITESQFVKFNKELANVGPLSEVIEEIIGDTLNKPNICDYVVVYIPDTDSGKDLYAVLIMVKIPMYSLDVEITKLIQSYIGIRPIVMVNDNYNCKKPQN